MNRASISLLITGLSMAMVSCNSPFDTADTTAPPSSTPPSSESATLVQPGDEASHGEIGREAGFDCVDIGDCSVLFTVESIDLLDSCPGAEIGEQPADTRLVRMPVTIKTKTSDFDYSPGEFAIWSEWSILTHEGINHPLRASSWCLNPIEETQWKEPIRVGDTVRHIHYADVPINGKELRLTETTVNSRWMFSIPKVEGAPTPQASTADPAPVPAPGPAPGNTPAPVAVLPAPAPAPDPAPAPAPAPVVGFTGAPGVDQPRVLDKSIASCGDPSIHQTGTTFFTDGTSGWTQQCADHMGY